MKGIPSVSNVTVELPCTNGFVVVKAVHRLGRRIRLQGQAEGGKGNSRKYVRYAAPRQRGTKYIKVSEIIVIHHLK